MNPMHSDWRMLWRHLPGCAAGLALLAGAALGAETGSGSEPLKMDLAGLAPAAAGEVFALGAARSPDGHELKADLSSLLRDGKRWLPAMGEFHYSRYPASEWRGELLKMKAGGIDILATYVFWIHHEEV